MKFEEALLHAVAYCESRGTDDPFYLYCVLSDQVGADFAGKDAASMFYEIDRRLRLAKGIARSGQAACAVFKAAYPAFKERYSQKEFCGFIDDVYCILTHAPRKEQRSAKKGIAPAKRGRGGKKEGKGHGRTPVPAPVRPNVCAQVPPNIPPKYCGLWLLKQAIEKKH